MASEGIEEYLEAIGKLEERGERVTTSSLARERGVAPPSVTQMLTRLSGLGLVNYQPRGDVALTEQGRSMARSVMRRHRLWERFLHDVLGIRWDRVHGEACKLEHATSPDIERQLAKMVGDSPTCPHGNTIPNSDGAISVSEVVPLMGLPPDQPARVARITDEDPVLLREIDRARLRPGMLIESVIPLPNDGVSVRVKDGEKAISSAAAKAIDVVPVGANGLQHITQLSELRPSETGQVVSLNAGKSLVSRCLALGFTPGASATMVRNSGKGPVIVRIRETNVALGRGEAQKIQVVRENGPDEPVD